MTENRQRLFKLLSVCLSYPDGTLFPVLDEIAEAARRLAGREGEAVHAFVDRLGAVSPLSAQEHWTAVFDLNPATSLNLTWHIVGDSQERGRTLAALVDVYRRAGFEPVSPELPDYLPLVLEFLAATAPAEPHPKPLADCLGVTPRIAARLKEAGSVYAPLLALVGDLAPDVDASAPGGHA